jgi:hypothetical protein
MAAQAGSMRCVAKPISIERAAADIDTDHLAEAIE